MDYKHDFVPTIDEEDLEIGVRRSLESVLADDFEEIDLNEDYLMNYLNMSVLRESLEKFYSINIPYVHLRMLGRRRSSEEFSLYELSPQRIIEYISSRVDFYSK